jgi:hypothetical protein
MDVGGPMHAVLMQLVRRRTDDERVTLNKLVHEVFNALERARLQPYSATYRSTKYEAICSQVEALIDAEAERALGTLKDCPTPPEPPEALERYRQAGAWHRQQIERMRVGSDYPGPMKPAEVEVYEAAWQRTGMALRECAQAAGVYWFRPSFLEQVRSDLTNEFILKVRRPPVDQKGTQRSSPVLRHNPLVGSPVVYFDNATAQGLLTKEEVQQQVPLPLVFLDDLKREGRSRAEEERRAESFQHNSAVDTLVGLLRRVGYRVYPGGVGLAGVYAMADLLAVRDDGLLFVECLTKSAIARGQHLKKRALAERVPFCFVGFLPEEFLKTLPQAVYAISYPSAPRMLDGAWAPRFYRAGTTFEARFRGAVTRGRKFTRITITLDGLRLQEDVSSFLWAALSIRAFRSMKEMQDLGWTIRFPRAAIGHIPFTRHGQPDSTFQLEGHGSSLIIRLGSVPAVAELQGSATTLDLVQSWLAEEGLPLEFA